MTKQDIERMLAKAEGAERSTMVLLAPEVAALCRIALIAIAAREAFQREGVMDDVR